MSDITHHMGFRDCCCQARTFTSKEARDAWENETHTCVGDEDNDQDDDFEVLAW